MVYMDLSWVTLGVGYRNNLNGFVKFHATETEILFCAFIQQIKVIRDIKKQNNFSGGGFLVACTLLILNELLLYECHRVIYRRIPFKCSIT